MPWFQIAILILQADIKQLLKQSAYFIQFNSESAGWNVVELQTMVLTRFWLTNRSNRSHEFFHSCQVSITQSASKIQTHALKRIPFDVPLRYQLRHCEMLSAFARRRRETQPKTVAAVAVSSAMPAMVRTSPCIMMLNAISTFTTSIFKADSSRSLQVRRPPCSAAISHWVGATSKVSRLSL